MKPDLLRTDTCKATEQVCTYIYVATYHICTYSDNMLKRSNQAGYTHTPHTHT
jgi:hypothetical protein